MGLLTDFFVASRSNAQGILDGTHVEGAPRAELKGVDPVKLKALGNTLAKQQGRKATLEETVMLTDQAAERWVLLVPPSLVDLLAEAGDLQPVSAAWAQTPELKADRWSLTDTRDVVDKLAALARDAKATNRDVLLRMSL